MRLSLLAAACLLLAAPGASARAGRQQADPRVRQYRQSLAAGAADEVRDQLLPRIRGADGPAELDALARVLAARGDGARAFLESLATADHAAAPGAAADLLWRIALRRRLSDGLATVAAGLLDHSDPFVAALAEWAIATRVGLDNGGQERAWPRPDAPAWFRKWASLPPEFLLQADYARQAIVWDIHHDGRKLLGSANKVLARAQAAAGDVAPEAAATAARRLARLRELRDELAASVKATPRDIAAHRKLWLAMRHEARPIVLANAAIDFHQVLFLTRHAAHSHRNITGSQYPWVHKPGGDICVQDGLAPGSEVRRVLDGQLGSGHVHGMDLWWEASRVCFAYARQPDWPPKWDAVRGNHVFLLRGDQEPTHIYEVRLDGSGLRQVTDHPYWSDFEPTYCPNGDIAFASDRSGRSSECGRFSADHTVINIYAAAPDGSRLRRLSDNKDIDRYPHCLDDGRIAYTRWDYQERHFFEVHAVWTVRPDGAMADAVFNQHIRAPYGLRDTRSVPASPLLVSVATGHHTFAYGPLVLLDPRKGINTPDAIRIVTPYVRPQEGPMAGRPVSQGGVPDRGGLYQGPWALSERCFLAAYSYARPPSDTGGGRNANNFAIYLLDAHGNKELVHRELLLSAAFPIPLRRRPRPHVLPDTTDRQQAAATCYVTDVYDGFEGVPRGAVRHIRILQRVGWPLDEAIGAMRWIPGNAWERHFGFWAWAPVRVIGTVDVAEDGSAHFQVPADAAVYFQALDERRMELRRMRSHVTFQPGEVRGCRGCHESQARAPRPGPPPRALRRLAQRPDPPPWGSRKLLGYEWLVQPILDRHCVRCHGREEPAGGMDLTATPAEGGFYQSFRTLFGDRPGAKKGPALVSVSDRLSGASVSRPRQFGSHKSPFVTVLIEDPLHRREVDLTDAEWRTLVTWVDANAPYFDTFYNRRPADGGKPRRTIRLELPPPFASAP
ncbi:MAG: hypothetical protein ACLF0G_14575 [Candidatus Brocadiia bacterium]